MTKKEAKLLKAARKLEKATKEYMKQLTKVDEVIQKLPVQLTRCYNLENDYFMHVPKVASISVQLELLYTKLDVQMNDHNDDEELELYDSINDGEF